MDEGSMSPAGGQGASLEAVLRLAGVVRRAMASPFAADPRWAPLVEEGLARLRAMEAVLLPDDEVPFLRVDRGVIGGWSL